MPAPDQNADDKAADEKQKFIRTLEQTGQLVDVVEGQDTSQLPAVVTHVRYPDGRVERIRFTGFGAPKS